MEGDIQVMSTLKSGREPPSEPLMLFGEEYYCEGLANDPEVEEFAELASEGLPNCVVATLLPWSVGHAPKGVLAPELESSDFLVPEAHIAKAVSGANTVLIPCTLEIEEEHEQAKRIIPQFARCDNVCIIGVLLLPKLTQLNRETNQIVLRRHNELLAAGVDDVLFEHEWDLVTLKRAVNLSRAMWEMNILRTRLMLNAEIDYDVAEDASRCQEEHSDLLFQQIPDALMPEFRSVDRHIIETGNSVGNFRLISMLSCKKGTVLQAVDEDQQAVAIKVFNKSQMVDPGVLESIYREYRFMGEVVRHPNITKCLEMLHSNSRLFLVMEFAGSQNIEHMLRGRTQQRMNESEVNNCFEQVVRGVAHLHSKNIAHRNICLQHLILSTLAGSDREHVRIVDFQSAMLVKPNMTSRTVCGTMPYMAPEMATGGPYWPHSADAWSCGVALLEMAGGLGSLRAAVKFDPEAAAESIAPTLMHFFEDPVSHSEALAVIDGVDTITVIEQLEQLLVPSWADRIVLKNLLPENQPGAEQELLQHEQQRLLEQQQQQQLLQMMQMGQVPQGQALPAPGQLGQMGQPILQQVVAAILMQQIIRAVCYMHQNNVTHRDLKPENFLFTSKEPIEKNFLKIIDFGLSCKYTDGQVLQTKAGTPYYVAPQVLHGKYDQAADLWSCGVIMFVLLCGYPPFFGDSDAEVLAKVKTGSYSFNPADWKNVSEDAKNLIRQLLKMNPKERYSAEAALNHEWIKLKAPKATNVSLQSNFVDNLRHFRSQNKLKKAALHIIAGQLNEDQIKQLRDVFMMIDGNGDGFLTVNELKEGLAKAGLKDIPPDLLQIMQEVDSDGSGNIDYTEFLAATLDKRMYIQEDVCWSAFRVFDRNGDGKISMEELQQVLGSNEVEEVVGAKALADLMLEVDGNGDGFIDFKEFLAMMRGQGKPGA